MISLTSSFGIMTPLEHIRIEDAVIRNEDLFEQLMLSRKQLILIYEIKIIT
jgi:hypothetical protein